MQVPISSVISFRMEKIKLIKNRIASDENRSWKLLFLIDVDKAYDDVLLPGVTMELEALGFLLLCWGVILLIGCKGAVVKLV